MQERHVGQEHVWNTDLFLFCGASDFVLEFALAVLARESRF